ncbi:MAG: hypothetical protein C4532_07455 [Candidatus Abyssobacteria bacterium SURF_17]|uniref:FecR protein domain-containing protein n=1 Tax=Candidatus Abyssobacteria bacterium SURF_17 TaxID=2093361 RepID=A0A419F0N6_9BACT|nr:MAG: hypothetical protein C4532_07455 [Candidatus Abyssubacteria bacterium SURF_17]
MNRKIISLVFIPIILFFFSATLPADVVELKNGEIIEGEITEETDQFIAIERDSETSFVKMDEVKAVTKSRLEAATGKVVEVTGAVEVLPKGQEQWTPAQKDMVLSEGDSVRTGPDSKAIAVFADQAIVAVEPKSNVGLDKLQQSPKKDLSAKVNLDGGQLWIDVGKLKTKNSKFQVTTPTSVTGVRGTVFTVEAASAEKTTIAVVDGGVDVRTREMIMKPVRVKENYMTEVTPNKPPTKPVAISAAFLAQWAIYQAQFGLLKGGMGAGLQISPGQAAVGGGAVAAAGVAAVAAQGGGGGGDSAPAAAETASVTASESGLFSPTPIDTEINGASVIGFRTVTGVDVRVLCDPFTVPDQFQIIYQGNVIGDTGMVGEDLGDAGENILLIGTATGSSSVVTIRVISGPLGTDWHWDARVIYSLE